MNEKDIYELIGESFDDKIKLNFDDVKNRIAKLKNKESAVITPITPSVSRKKTVFAVVAAAAACLVCVIGLSVVFSETAKKADSEAYMMYDSMKSESITTADDSYNMAFESAAEESTECYDSATPETNIADGTLDDMFGEVCDQEAEAVEDAVSDSDMSQSNLYSDSDIG